MLIKKIPIQLICPATYNPRLDLRPTDPTYKKLEKSLLEFGCVKPLVWNEQTGNLVGGHQRLKILKAQGDKEVTCCVVNLSLEQEKSLNLALNKISGDWDENTLAKLLDELLRVPELDLDVTGFELSEATNIIDQILHSSVGESFDLDTELTKIAKPKTRIGDIIQLGKHRLICGDSKNENSFQQLMGERKAQLIFTDPPYAVDYRGGAAKKNKSDENNWDNLSAKEYEQLLLSMLTNCSSYSDRKSALYLWFASSKIDSVIDALKATKWQRRNLLIWAKNTFAGSVFAQYKHKYEPCFYCFKKGQSPRWCGPNNESTVWDCDKPQINEEHPTIKPLALAMRAIRNSSAIGDLVLDPFLGSGTSLIAAERMGRTCYGIELEPKYCDLAVQRYIATAGEGTVSKDILNRYSIERINK